MLIGQFQGNVNLHLTFEQKKSLQNYHVTDNFGGGHFLNEKMLMASVRLKRFPSFSAARLIF